MGHRQGGVANDGGTNLVAVKLRLVRMGKKKQPTYRVVAADSRSPRDGRFLEIVGTYAPRGRSTTERDAIVSIDNAKAIKWLSNGAKPTERVEKLLRTSGAWDEWTDGPREPAPAVAAATPATEATGDAAVAAATPATEVTATGEAIDTTEATEPGEVTATGDATAATDATEPGDNTVEEDRR